MKNYLLLIPIILLSCKSNLPNKQEQTATPPTKETIAKSNDEYANVFKALDGIWKGEFIVYEDSRGQIKGHVQPKEVSYDLLKSLPLTESLRIDVEQIYQSSSPFYQTVQITDTYKEADGRLKTVKSEGYNEVKNGQLLCVVNKPDEQVIHKGSNPGKDIIIWERSLKDPLKIEYFYEEVKENTYSIIGWGYYGNDNPTLSPKTWFYAAYKKQ